MKTPRSSRRRDLSISSLRPWWLASGWDKVASVRLGLLATQLTVPYPGICAALLAVTAYIATIGCERIWVAERVVPCRLWGRLGGVLERA